MSVGDSLWTVSARPPPGPAGNPYANVKAGNRRQIVPDCNQKRIFYFDVFVVRRLELELSTSFRRNLMANADQEIRPDEKLRADTQTSIGSRNQ